MRRNIAGYFREFRDTYRKNAYHLKPYLLRDGKEHPVAVICPGGGYGLANRGERLRLCAGVALSNQMFY